LKSLFTNLLHRGPLKTTNRELASLALNLTTKPKAQM